MPTIISVIVIVGTALVVYHPILWSFSPSQRYPWASDTWGHLIKVEYLDQELRQGHLYPDIFPAWYNGIQMLRYYAPVPYYLMVPILRASGDIFFTGNVFIFTCELLGSLSLLLFRSRIGLLPATLTALLALILPDHLRVAFAEGNLPRVLAAALLPGALYLVLRLLSERPRRRHFVALSLLMALIVLSHAMMAAIFAVGLGLFVLAYWQLGRAHQRAAITSIIALATGILLAGWWLLPSLVGGITEIDQTAASEAIAYFPPSIAFNPLLRVHDPEIFYAGLSFVGTLILALAYWRRLSPLTKSLFLVGALTVLVDSSLVRDLYAALPFHQLFWPIRFMSFAGPVLLLASMTLADTLRRQGSWHQLWFGIIVLGLAADFHPSLHLIHLQEAPLQVEAIADRLAQLPGWRVATADLSRLGSSPSLLFGDRGHRDQVYGWAYQGATTAPLVANINYALSHGYPRYAVDRLNLLGTDDVVTIDRPEIPADFRQELVAAGFHLDQHQGALDLYHRDGGPRAYLIHPDILGIGEGTENLAFLFPQVLSGSSPYVDDYSLDFLRKFRVVVLSRFRWHRRVAAEALIRAYAQQGGKVVVDLTAAPSDAFAREPKFLDVYAEPVLGLYHTNLHQGSHTFALRPFPSPYLPWVTYTPQGLDHADTTFDYLGIPAVAIGEKRVGNAGVTFVGLNLIFQAVLTRDPVSIQVLSHVIGAPSHVRPTRTAIPLISYREAENGEHFHYQLKSDGLLLIPVADNDGTVAYVDGQVASSWSMSHLVLLAAASGTHDVVIASHPTPSYSYGRIGTVLGLLILGWCLFKSPTTWRRPAPAPDLLTMPHFSAIRECEE